MSTITFLLRREYCRRGWESVESELWRGEARKAFKTAFLSLATHEKELFGKVHGVNIDTFETFSPIDRETLALTYNYADESSVRKVEDEICIKIAAELCKIDFADAVYAKKISPPKNEGEEFDILCVPPALPKGRRRTRYLYRYRT